MKLYLITSGLIVMLVAATVQATTLKLSSEVDLLVLDGHKISGSLLKGADGLELASGEHQLLFRIERKDNPVTSVTVDWISLPQIVTFIAYGREVMIKIPVLQTLHDSKIFDKNSQFIMIDEQGNEIASKRDRLTGYAHSNFEQAMMNYNLDNKTASVPRFAQLLHRATAQAAYLHDRTFSQHYAEHMLHL